MSTTIAVCVIDRTDLVYSRHLAESDSQTLIHLNLLGRAYDFPSKGGEESDE